VRVLSVCVRLIWSAMNSSLFCPSLSIVLQEQRTHKHY
jgi:hypothetical protein